MKKISKEHSWIITDGTKGMENQSIALAKLLNVTFDLILFQPPYLLRQFPILGVCFPKSLINISFEKRAPAQFLITTGKRMAGISIFLKRSFKNKIKTIHIQNPKVSSNYFDLLLIPEHDNIYSKNIIQTKGALSFFDKEVFQKSNKTISKTNAYSSKLIVLALIGGDNKRYNFKNTDYYNLGLQIAKASKDTNTKLIVSTSRRTSLRGIKVLNSVFKKYHNDFFLWAGKGQNPYPDILKSTNYVIVTSDSVNMISEAASLNLPLFVAYINKEKGKMSIFLKDLEKLNIVQNFEGKLFNYNKVQLETNSKTSLKVNKFFRT